MRKGLTEIILGASLLVVGVSLAVKDMYQYKKHQENILPALTYLIANIGGSIFLTRGARKY